MEIVDVHFGFVRLAFDGQYYYVGQSEDMYTSQNFGGNNFTTMCNAGIYKVDVEKIMICKSLRKYEYSRYNNLKLNFF